MDPMRRFNGVYLLFLLAVAAWSQTQSRLTGLVTDSSGAVVVGVKVTVRNAATGVTTEATTSEAGTYQFPFLIPGNYELTCEQSGFKKVLRKGIVLDTGTTRTVDIALEVGATTETVQVTATAPLLDSESSTVGQLIERTTVFRMPLESRRTAGLVRLLGGVVFKQENAGEQVPLFSMAGGRSQNQMWQLDGGVVQNMALGVAQLQLNPPAESLQEFKAETNNFSAEFGRSGNGLILMTTRSGTNQFHGAAYEFLRNQALDTRTFFAPAKSPLRYNIFGASFGGPIIRDKTFFFANYEGARRRDGLTQSGNNIPRPTELRGDFSARRDVAILDPISRAPFPGNIVPQSRIDPIAAKFATLYPTPNVPGDDITRAPANNFIINNVDRLNQDSGTLRVDHNISEKDRVFGRYSVMYAPFEVAALFPNAGSPSGGPRENKINSILGSWIHNFKPAVINELRYSWSSRTHINRSAGFGSKFNGEAGLPGVDPNAIATLGVTGHTSIGAGTYERIQTPILTHQFIDNLTIIKGKHTLKMGGEMRYSLNKDDFNQQVGGNFSFNDRATRSGVVSLLLGHVTGASLVDADLLQARSDFWGAYFQDDWKVSRNLTLNLGLRWDLDTPRWESTDNRQSGFDGAKINPVSGTPGIITFSGRDGVSKYAHRFDRNNFGPRFGFAYRAPRSVVVRGGYGISYAGAYAGAVANPLSQGFSTNASFSSPDGGLTAIFPFRSGIPASASQREPLGPGFGAVRFGQAPRTSPDFISQDQQNGYSQQYNLTIQKEIAGTYLVEASYMGNLGRKLGGPNININMIPLVNGRGPATQSQQARPWAHFNNITMISPFWGKSSYHALNIKFEKRYSNGLNFLMNYTFSKFLDNIEANNELAGGEGNGYTHIELLGLNKSYSGNDIRNRYIGSTVYELPIGKGKKVAVENPVLNAIVGGWSMGAILEARSGAPWGSIVQTNITNTFSNSNRPNLTCNPGQTSGDRGQRIAQWFNTGCFSLPVTGEFGSAPRVIGFGPGFLGLDASLTKRWDFNERYNLQFRTDIFNLPNRPNFSVPNAVFGRGDFGRVTSTIGTGRQLQMSLRLEF
jgi:hypothetical protein